MTQKTKNEKVYRSPSTGIECDSAQYIAEVMCQRKAIKDKIPSLEFKFWNKSQKQNYQAQIVAARRLINEFGEKAVLEFLKNNQFIYSLGRYNSPKFIKDGIKKCVKNNSPKEPIIKYEVEESSSRKSRQKGNLFNKIKKAQDG